MRWSWKVPHLKPILSDRWAVSTASPTGAEIAAALKAYQKDFTTNTVKALREAKTRGLI